VLVDSSTGFELVTRSTMKSKETRTIDGVDHYVIEARIPLTNFLDQAKSLRGALVSGNVRRIRWLSDALRRWLACHARETLGPQLKTISTETGLRFNRLTIKSQRTLWGSCSADGIISLNCKLLFLPSEMVRYVLVHELCHILERNHTTRFWTHLRQFEPRTDKLHVQMREAWKMIPTWAHPVQAIREGL